MLFCTLTNCSTVLYYCNCTLLYLKAAEDSTAVGDGEGGAGQGPRPDGGQDVAVDELSGEV